MALLTVQQAAAHLTISPDAVYTLVKERKIEHVRLGKRIRFLKADLDRFVNGSRVLSHETEEMVKRPRSRRLKFVDPSKCGSLA